MLLFFSVTVHFWLLIYRCGVVSGFHMILLMWQVFWLIPPTHDNVERYVNWVLSAKQGDYFLADHMDQCQMLRLKAGYTFIIPSGQSGYTHLHHPFRSVRLHTPSLSLIHI